MKELVEKLNEELTENFNEYLKLHREFDAWRGKALTGDDHVEVNRILGLIQVKFAELYGVYHFIASRYQHAVDTTNKYNDFIEALKKDGVNEEIKETGNA